MAALQDGFLRSVQRCGSRCALEAAGSALTYDELAERAGRVAAAVQDADEVGTPLTAVLADRTPAAFAGVLGALLAGHGYVPLNPTYPTERTRLMLERSQARTVVCDPTGAAQLAEVLAGLEPRTVILEGGDHASAGDLAAALPDHRIVGPSDLPAADARRAVELDPQAFAYLMFTSGSTGAPKGVMISHANVRHYVSAMTERYVVDETDRFSQTAELTFDNSIFDLFCAWERGARVCCPERRTLVKPGRWLAERELTIWFSVPSTAIFMRRFGQLKPGRYPSLRWSLFAGEPLPLELAQAWLVAAPNSTVENLYGPTEMTDVCIVHRHDPDDPPYEMGTVPIGRPLPGLAALIADEELREVPPGEIGELLVAGPQVSQGYWRDPGRTARAFVVPPGRDTVHYRTGDRARRPRGDDDPIIFLGRVDYQVQIFGERFELGEVEAVLREASGCDGVAAIGWPVSEAGPTAVTAFVEGDNVDVDAVRVALRERLLGHAVPRHIHAVSELPKNANGKIDRAALTAWLENPTDGSAP